MFVYRNNTPRAPRQNVVYTSLKEDEIGITEYTTTTKGFTGIIKQRLALIRNRIVLISFLITFIKYVLKNSNSRPEQKIKWIDLKWFNCRISDFHVNEIGFDGKLCKLTDFSLPKPPECEFMFIFIDSLITNRFSLVNPIKIWFEFVYSSCWYGRAGKRWWFHSICNSREIRCNSGHWKSWSKM